MRRRGGAPAAAGPGPAAGPDRFKMKEKIASIGDDFWIETMAGRKAYYVDGKALRLRETVVLKEARGGELFQIQSKVVAIKDKMAIEKDGREVAVVKKALVTPLRDRMTVNVTGGPDIEVKGNILAHEYTMERGGRRICEVSKRWVSIRDIYTVEAAAGEDPAFLLAVTVVIERMTD